jgi:hypothetical protein
MDEKALDVEMMEAMAIAWEDEARDLVELKRIFDDENPDGVMKGLIEIPAEMPNDPDQPFEIRINPTVVRWMEYFMNKYGERKGRLLLIQFQNREVFKTHRWN